MYSPKIPERLIPALYRLARARGKPMTTIVAEALEAYLASEGIALDKQADYVDSHSDPSTRRLKRAA
jgi:predicted DNA-binding protein